MANTPFKTGACLITSCGGYEAEWKLVKFVGDFIGPKKVLQINDI
jgi:hypothetical protein